jgi:SAM-dependent methyltransferase
MIYSATHCRHGRLGNQLFRLMSMIGLAKTHQTTYCIPKWKYAEYFQGDIPQADNVRCNTHLKEPVYHYNPEFFKITDRNVDIHGWLQCWEYWKDAETEVRATLKFKNAFISSLQAKYEAVFTKPVVCISIRRGDFVGNKNYYQLPVTYYIGALLENFPDWKERNLFFFSDDIPYCRAHFECLDNAFFAEGIDIEQLALMTLCDDFIISNSTFSWVGAYLANKGKVIRPNRNLDGPLAKTHDEKSFWFPGWQIFNQEGYKIDLKDATFTVPVHYDHPDRKQNLDLSLCLLQRDFETSIIVMEQGTDKFKYVAEFCRYEKFEGKDFHRTKMLNLMAEMAGTDIVVNWDADTFLPPMQVLQAVDRLRQGVDMVYPFDGRSARVPRTNFPKLEKFLDVGIFGTTQFKGMDKYDSVGHCVMVRTDSFIEGGMENENMISFGPEDVERYERFKRLGYKVEKIKGPVYHMDHYIGVNSGTRNPYFKANWAELDKIRAMSDHQLREYVGSWTWAHPYTAAYYQTIIEKAIKSRDEVFKILTDTYKLKFTGVVDVGCGCGEWLYQIEKYGTEYYAGIDYNVSRRKLLIPEGLYFDIDLTKGKRFLNSGRRFDLAICVEVAEHLPESSSEELVKHLCSLSDYVLFSAAIPYQTGVGHVNEQWQTWWEELFNQNGYYASEQPLRELLQDNQDVEIWYRQNIVLYSKHFKGKVTDYVHPAMYLNLINHYKQTA